jgi:hypothetical protein
MRKQLAAGIAACCLLASLATAAQPDEPLEVLDTALVVGDQPGPGLWKVTRGDNVLWLLGSTRFVPARATWRAEQVKARIAESQQVLQSLAAVAALILLAGATFAAQPDEQLEVLDTALAACAVRTGCYARSARSINKRISIQPVIRRMNPCC